MSTLPPGPETSKFELAIAWFRDTERLLETSHAQYGDLFTLRLPPSMNETVVVVDPDQAKTVLASDPDRAQAGASQVYLRPLVGTHSLLTLDGANHRRHRRLMNPIFQRRQLETFSDLVRQITLESVNSWPLGEPFSLHERMRAITIEMVLRAVFGVDADARRASLATRIRPLVESSQAGFTREPVIRRWQDNNEAKSGSELQRGAELFVETIDEVDELLFDLIAERRQSTDLETRNDMLSILLSSRTDDGSGLSNEELRDELMTLLVAGYETTATALTWSFDLLLHHPEKLARLRGEPAAGSQYLDAVIEETLRMRPPLYLTARKLTLPIQLGEYEIPSGTTVAPCFYLIHRRPDLYQQPLSFIPERFLGDRATAKATWLPFGGGRRRCIGANLALLEMRCVISTVLAHLSLEPVDGLDEAVRAANTFVPKNGVMVTASGRSFGQARVAEPASARDAQ